MFRWRRRLLFAPLVLALATGAAPAISAAAASPAAAADNVVTVTGGSATTVTAPGVVGKLIGAGIVPLALPPGTMSINGPLTNLTATTTFPVSSGSVDFTTFNGQVELGGGLLLTHLLPLSVVKLNALRIEIVNGVTTLTAATPSGTRIALFALSLSGATLGGDATHIVIGNLATTVTADGARFLDSSLHTNVFTAGMLFGTSSSTFEHA
jgi:hypothetical protein